MDFISFRIAGKSYSIYGMSPLTAIRIMQARDIKKELDKSIGCLKAMTQSVALGISDSKNIFNILKRIVLRRKFLKIVNRIGFRGRRFPLCPDPHRMRGRAPHKRW